MVRIPSAMAAAALLFTTICFVASTSANGHGSSRSGTLAANATDRAPFPTAQSTLGDTSNPSDRTGAGQVRGVGASAILSPNTRGGRAKHR